MTKRFIRIFAIVVLLACLISSAQVTFAALASDLQADESIAVSESSEVVSGTESSEAIETSDTTPYEETAYVIGEKVIWNCASKT